MIFADVGISVIFATTFAHSLFGWILIVTFGIITTSAFALICAHHQNNEQISFRVIIFQMLLLFDVISKKKKIRTVKHLCAATIKSLRNLK